MLSVSVWLWCFLARQVFHWNTNSLRVWSISQEMLCHTTPQLTMNRCFRWSSNKWFLVYIWIQKKTFLNWLENDGIWMYVIMFLIFINVSCFYQIPLYRGRSSNCHLNTSGQVLECHMTWLFNERLVSGWERNLRSNRLLLGKERFAHPGEQRW